MVNVDCSRAGPGALTLEAALDSSPTTPTSSVLGSGKSLNPYASIQPREVFHILYLINKMHFIVT